MECHRKVKEATMSQIPRILIEQATRHFAPSGHGPFMSKFESSILFVDISGFTNMSVKMNVDEFCRAINRYFTIMLTIIERWGGDTIKFAGDALLVVWQHRDEDHLISAWECVHRGVLCGQELVCVCNNYIVTSAESHSLFNDSNVEMASKSSAEQSFTLNIRSAVSYGHMAGVDVGCLDRWEYFVVGNPLATIGSALEQARQGSVVLTRKAHDIYASDMDQSLVVEESGALLVRGFRFLLDGCVAAEASVDGFAPRQHDASSPLKSSGVGKLDYEHRMASAPSDSIIVSHEFELMMWRHVHEAVRPSLANTYHEEERLDMDLAPQEPTLSSSSSSSIELEAELRNIVTMFINVDVSQLLPHLTEWDISNNKSTADSTNSGGESHNTVCTSGAELLHPLQQCMEIFVRSLREHGGQLRQFLLDDKGCVCIGTFGLRHSVTGDNRAAAVASAQTIVHRLEAMGVGASVGIATGLAYCGLVGSPQRHEYAVMGRSVNLAARLMGFAAKAKADVLCDETTQLGDKRHSFVRTPDVVAKGYDHKVRAFRPIEFKSASSPEMREDLREYLRTKVDFSFNRIGDLEEIIDFVDNVDGSMSGPKMVFAKGAHGIGKSLLLDLVSDFLLWRGQGRGQVSECPVAVLSGRAERANAFSPFAPWKSILTVLFRLIDEAVEPGHDQKIGKLASQQCNNGHTGSGGCGDGAEGGDPQHDRGSEAAMLCTSSVRGWELVKRRLPSELQSHSSLCTELVFPLLPSQPEDAATKALAGIKRGQQTVQVLVGVMKAATEMLTSTIPTWSRSRVVIKLDSIENMDFWSWGLVEELFKSTDVVWLCSMATHVGTRSELQSCGSDDRTDIDAAKADDVDMGPSNQAALTFIEGLLMSHPDQVLPIRLNEFVGFGVKEYLSTLILEHFTNEDDDEDGSSSEDEKNLANAIDMLQATIGGNPMQAQLLVELAAVDCSSVRDLKEFLMANSSKVRPDHVEDVLMVEYDRMDTSTQKILKAASVAAINGASFTVSALLAVLSMAKDEGLDVTSGLMFQKKFMRKYVKRSNFLAIRTQDEFHTGHTLSRPMFFFNQHDDESSSGSDNDDTRESEPLIYFRLKSAQEMIYSLLIDDQKIQYHSRMAMHLEAEALSRGGECVSGSEWNLQALHWRRSKGWTKAMCCYFQAAKAMEAVGAMADTKRFFCAAHSCLQALKRDGEMAPSCTFVVGADGKVTQIDNTGTKKRTTSAGTILARVVDGVAPDYALSEQRAVHSVFQGDVIALEIAISMLIRFFQCLLTVFEPTFVSAVMEEALYFVLAARMPVAARVSVVAEAGTTKASSSLSQSRHLHSNLSLLKGRPVDSSSNVDDDGGCEDPPFCIRDKAMLFPILSGLALCYNSSQVPDDEEFSQLNKVATTFLTLARDHGDPVHIIRALMFLVFVERMRRNQGNFTRNVDQVSELYVFDVHSKGSMVSYGTDFGLTAIAYGAQACARKHDLAKCGEYLSRVWPCLPLVSHCHSLTLATFPLFSLFLALEMFDEAFLVMRRLFQFDATWKGFTITRYALPFLAELSIVLAHSGEGDRQAARQGAREGLWADAQSLELMRDGKAVLVKFNHLVAHFVFDVNVAKGHLCLLRADESMIAAMEASSGSGVVEGAPDGDRDGDEAVAVVEEAQLYLGAVLSYTESAVVPMGDTANETMIGNKIMALQIRARAHALLVRLKFRLKFRHGHRRQSGESAATCEGVGSSDGLEELVHVGHVRSALDECEAVCARLGHPLLALGTALLRVELAAEAEEKEEAKKRMQKMYHAMSLGSRGWSRGQGVGPEGPDGSEGGPRGYEGGGTGGDAEAWETRLRNAPFIARVKACLEL